MWSTLAKGDPVSEEKEGKTKGPKGMTVNKTREGSLSCERRRDLEKKWKEMRAV